MIPLSKLCDAADWFDPEIDRIIREELREVPYFHRKQWEFALIFHALQRLGLLGPDRTGLSMGGGRELLLYALAPHSKQLTVTDLYDSHTTWDCAKTDDPDTFLKTNMPLQIDTAKLRGLRMDMRDLEFDDNTFDFAYSSCAIEHIGGHEDFLRHLNEAYRVLKDGGAYVFTTEFNYGPELIEHPNNYIFAAEYLASLIAETSFVPDAEFDAHIAHHRANYPVPANLGNLAFAGRGHLSTSIVQQTRHMQLLRGRQAYTSAIFVLRKDHSKEKRPIRFIGLRESHSFVEAGLGEYRSAVQENRVTLDPFVLLPGGSSFYFAGHEGFFSRDRSHQRDYETVFHSDYVWLGSGDRILEMRMNVRERSDRCSLDLRVHSMKTVSNGTAETVRSVELPVLREGILIERISFKADDNFSYAALAHVVEGYCVFESIELTVYPSGFDPRENTLRAASKESMIHPQEHV